MNLDLPLRVVLSLAGRGATAEERKRFRCQRCGRCCIVYPVMPLSKEDIRAIDGAGYDRKRFLRLGKFLKTPHGRCCFLLRDADGYSCEIYEHRPSCCKSYPFHPVNEKVVATMTAKCPALAELRGR